VADSKRKNGARMDSATRNKLAENAKTIEVDKHIVRKIDIKAALSKKYKRTKRTVKDSSNCLFSLSSNLG